MFTRKPFARQSSGLRVAFVGPCGVGKSTIVKQLRTLGMDARMPAQEHSGVPDMWRKLLQPDYLIALDAPNHILRQRRPTSNLNDIFLAKERRRLAHAFAHADLMLDTSRTNIEETISLVLKWLEKQTMTA